MLLVEELRVRLGRQQVLDDTNLRCDDRSVTVVVGANGAGKTTLLRTIAGIIAPDHGVIELDGASIVGRRSGARSTLGYVPEAADAPGHLSVNELIDLCAALKNVPSLSPELRDQLGLRTLGNTRIDRLSLGERRRACLAAALVGQPRLLVLDEPTNGLDSGGVALLTTIVRQRAERGCAVLLASHDVDFAARLEARTVELRGGRLLAR